MFIIDTLLIEIGLSHLLQKFHEGKVDLNNIIYATDNDLSKLGVMTIGDRAQLREGCPRHIQKQQNNSTINIEPSGQGSSQNIRYRASEVREERSVLFSPLFMRGRASGGGGTTASSSKTGKKQVKKRQWTGNFMCLANKFSQVIPNSEEKERLI